MNQFSAGDRVVIIDNYTGEAIEGKVVKAGIYSVDIKWDDMRCVTTHHEWEWKYIGLKREINEKSER